MNTNEQKRVFLAGYFSSFGELRYKFSEDEKEDAEAHYARFLAHQPSLKRDHSALVSVRYHNWSVRRAYDTGYEFALPKMVRAICVNSTYALISADSRDKNLRDAELLWERKNDR